MKKIKVEDAVGTVLAHDLTKIVSGEFKGPAFKKGYIVQQEDIDELKSMGKNHLYVIELNAGQLHEEEAAQRIALAAAGENLYLTPPSEGKVNVKASERGLLKINLPLLEAVNEVDLVVLATLHHNTLVEKDQLVAGAKVIPLTIAKDTIAYIEGLCHGHQVLTVNPLASLPVGIVVTGTEVYSGMITDRFGPVLADKADHYQCPLVGMVYAPDDIGHICRQVEELVEAGARIVMVSGGMSVDADDLTPLAIRQLADEVITYGSPVLPGAMFMLAYRDDIALIGVPACGMFHRYTVLDLVLPRLLAGERLTKRDLTALAHGGLCQNCAICHYPVCPFGK